MLAFYQISYTRKIEREKLGQRMPKNGIDYWLVFIVKLGREDGGIISGYEECYWGCPERKTGEHSRGWTEIKQAIEHPSLLTLTADVSPLTFIQLFSDSLIDSL